MSETELKARFTALKKRLLDKIYGRLNDMQREAFFAPHTPKTRKLTCVKGGHRGFCGETYGRVEK